MIKRRISIQVKEYDTSVSGILQVPDQESCLMVLAHGAGAGMEHPFMNSTADALAGRGIGTLRFNFIYMEEGKRRPDPPAKALAAIKNALYRGQTYADKNGLLLIAGGKSFGGRMLSKLAADEGLGASRGLVFFGFPLHAAGKPGTDRAVHLKEVKVPMLFLQGTRDTLADLKLIKSVVKKLPHGSLSIIEGADHGFHMLKSSGVGDDEVIADLANRTADWLGELE